MFNKACLNCGKVFTTEEITQMKSAEYCPVSDTDETHPKGFICSECAPLTIGCPYCGIETKAYKISLEGTNNG